jgi:hypothetical protein
MNWFYTFFKFNILLYVRLSVGRLIQIKIILESVIGSFTRMPSYFCPDRELMVKGHLITGHPGPRGGVEV